MRCAPSPRRSRPFGRSVAAGALTSARTSCRPARERSCASSMIAALYRADGQPAGVVARSQHDVGEVDGAPLGHLGVPLRHQLPDLCPLLTPHRRPPTGASDLQVGVERVDGPALDHRRDLVTQVLPAEPGLGQRSAREHLALVRGGERCVDVTRVRRLPVARRLRRPARRGDRCGRTRPHRLVCRGAEGRATRTRAGAT